MNETMTIIRDFLSNTLNAIDTGKFYLTEKQAAKIAKYAGTMFSPSLNRQEVLEELGICDTTLRKKLKDGEIPKGTKIKGTTTQKWSKQEIEKLTVKKRKPSSKKAN